MKQYDKDSSYIILRIIRFSIKNFNILEQIKYEYLDNKNSLILLITDSMTYSMIRRTNICKNILFYHFEKKKYDANW